MASNIGGMPEIIKNGYNGFIFKSNNINEIDKLLNYFKKKEGKFKLIKKNARITFKKLFQSYQMYKKYSKEINNL